MVVVCAADSSLEGSTQWQGIAVDLADVAEVFALLQACQPHSEGV